MQPEKNYNLITILGPTATGKTSLAVKLADHFDGEIISADSRQVYKYMNIGTGKDLDDYRLKGKTVPFHLIDIAEPGEEFNLYRFNEEFRKSFEAIILRKRTPFLVGGSGMYLSSVIQQYHLIKDEQTEIDKLNKLSLQELRSIYFQLETSPHNITDTEDKERLIKAISILRSSETETGIPEINSFNIGIKISKDDLKRRINARLKKRFKEGMIDEVKGLIERGISIERLKQYGLEYKFISQYLNNELNYNDMFQKLNSAINNFAKRQRTWFRKMEKEGVEINWIDPGDFSSAKSLISSNFS